MTDTPNSVMPLEGKTTIDEKMFFEPERLSYESARDIAAEIAQTVAEKTSGKIVVIAGTQLLTDLANLQAAYFTLANLRSEYQGIYKLALLLNQKRSMSRTDAVASHGAESVVAAIAGAIAPATAIVSSALGLISLFREDVEFHGAQATVDRLAFEIALAAALKDQLQPPSKVIIPDLHVGTIAQPTESSLAGRLAQVESVKSKAWVELGPLISKLIETETELEEASRKKDQAEFDRLAREVSELRRDMEPITAPLGRADQRLAELHNQWSVRDETTGQVELAGLLRAESLATHNPTYLHSKVVSAGGHHRISRSLLRTIFIGDGLSFTGGAIVRWALFDNSGSVDQGGINVKRLP